MKFRVAAMKFWVATLLMLTVAGATLAAAASGGLVAKAPAGSRPAAPPPLKHYDPLP